MADFVTGDTGSKLVVTCKDSETDAVIDLTGAAIVARWEDASGIMLTKTMTITNATGGVAEYQYLAGEIVYPKMRTEIEITDSGGFIVSNLTLIELTVREELG